MVSLTKDYPSIIKLGLLENYRSTSCVTAVANSILGKVGTVPIAAEGGEPVRLVTCFDDDAQADCVTAIVKTLAVAGRKIAVLYRTNAQSRSLEKALNIAQIKFEIVGGLRFFDRKEIKDCLCYLRLLANPWDKEATKRLLGETVKGIGPKKASKFFDWTEQSQSEAAMNGVAPPSILDHFFFLAGRETTAEVSACPLDKNTRKTLIDCAKIIGILVLLYVQKAFPCMIL